jgi:DNA-binding CsgD family transcriptional regulator
VEGLVSTAGHDPPEPRFTAREKAALRLLVEGYTAEEAAQRLQMALPTVQKHLNNIRLKLGPREGY